VEQYARALANFLKGQFLQLKHVYVEICFIAAPEVKVYPDNWAWESIAATGRFIFAHRDFDPFALHALAQRVWPGGREQ